MRIFTISCHLALACVFGGLVPSAGAAPVPYYVGRDTGGGPNQGHLTLLFNHGDHFHRLGTFGVSEGRVPEAYLGDHALRLEPGVGAFVGQFISTPYDIPGDVTGEYSDLSFRSVNTLLGHGSNDPETLLVSGSGSRYLGDLSGVRVGLELLSKVGDVVLAGASGQTLLAQVGDIVELGSGVDFGTFLPVIVANLADLSPRVSLRMRLVDLNGVAGESGAFTFEAQAAPVPEPASLVMLGLGGAGVLAHGLLRRRRRATVAPVTYPPAR